MKGWAAIAFGIAKWGLLVAYLVIALSFASRRGRQVVCGGIRVEILDSLNHQFVTQRDVVRQIERRMHSPIGHPLVELNTHEMEQHLREFHAVDRVVAYTSSDGYLNIRLTQREPIMRVINRQGRSYYIDSQGLILPLSRRFTAHVLVVNGAIDEPFEIEPNVRVQDWAQGQEEAPPLIYQLFRLAEHISQDPFWRAQIAQVYVDSPRSVELIPRVGSHVVLLGGLNDYPAQLRKLKVFYQQALRGEGWNQYRLLNLKYNNQIIATKR